MATEATLVLDIDSSGAVGAAKALAGLNQYAAATATVGAKLEKQWDGVTGSFREQTVYIAKNEQEIRRLASAYNPTLAAQLRFAEAQKEVARAVQLGVIPASRQADVLRELQVQYAVTDTATRGWLGGMSKGVHQVQNFGYQIGDFAVQVASGQNAVMALSQQLPQLLGGFGAIGAVAGAATAILGAVWMSMGAGRSASEKLAASVDKVSGAIGEMRDLSASLSFDGLDNLAERYGRVDARVINLINNQRMYNEMLASAELKNSIAALSEFGTGRWYDVGISDAASAVLKLRSAFDVTKVEAEGLRDAFVAVGNARGPEAQVEALERVSSYLSEILSTSEEVTSEQLETYKGVLDAVDAAKQLLAVSGRIPGQFENAAASARSITDALNNAVSAAARLANAAINDQKFAEIELRYRTDPVARAGALAAARVDSEMPEGGFNAQVVAKYRAEAVAAAEATARLNQERERLDELDRKAEQAANRGGSAGARAQAQAEKGFQSLRELLERESQFQFAEYEKRNAQLSAALNRNLVTEQQYREYSDQLKMAYFGTEYEQQQVQYQLEHEALKQALDLQYITRMQYEERVAAMNASMRGRDLQHYSTFFGNMANVAKAGGDKASAIVKAFSIAQGLTNSYLAYTQVLADPSLVGRPFLRTALAASTLASGLAQVANMKSGGGGGSARGAATSTSASAAVAEPDRSTYVTLNGEPWMVDLADKMMTEIFKASKNGRVVVARAN